jgi:hypothetical protein
MAVSIRRIVPVFLTLRKSIRMYFYKGDKYSDSLKEVWNFADRSTVVNQESPVT